MENHQKLLNLNLSKIQKALKAKILVGIELETKKISNIYASDLMSDVLAYGKAESCLLSGLNSVQTLISSYMAEFKAVVLIRGKTPNEQMVKFAEQRELVLLSTEYDMFESCIKLFPHNNDIDTIGEYELTYS